jgi:hypothetical protein
VSQPARLAARHVLRETRRRLCRDHCHHTIAQNERHARRAGPGAAVGPAASAPLRTGNSECGPEGLSGRTSATATPETKAKPRQRAHSGRRGLPIRGGAGKGVRIAHLDTGHDLDHKSLPEHLRADLARNFVDADQPKDATDRSEGTLFNNFSHGCDTLSILAGTTVPGLKPFGCAPNAEIVPVRVATILSFIGNTNLNLRRIATAPLQFRNRAQRRRNRTESCCSATALSRFFGGTIIMSTA